LYNKYITFVRESKDKCIMFQHFSYFF